MPGDLEAYPSRGMSAMKLQIGNSGLHQIIMMTYDLHHTGVCTRRHQKKVVVPPKPTMENDKTVFHSVLALEVMPTKVR